MTIIIVSNEGIIADRYVDSDNIRATGPYMRTKIFHDPEINAFVTTGLRGADPDDFQKIADYGFNQYREKMGIEVKNPVELPTDLKAFELLIVTAPYNLNSSWLISKKETGNPVMSRFKADVCYAYGHESTEARIAYDFTRDLKKAFVATIQNYVTMSRIYDFVDFKNVKAGVQNAVC